MQRAFDHCPGVVTGRLPASEQDQGWFIIEPGCAKAALEFLRRRFFVDQQVEIESTGELRLAVVPKIRRAGMRKIRMDFRKPIEQFEFRWTQ